MRILIVLSYLSLLGACCPSEKTQDVENISSTNTSFSEESE